jgi:hypothetical protein
LPKRDQDPLTLKRNDGNWTVHQGDKSAAVRSFEIDNLLRTLSTLQPERIVSRKEEKWDQYQVSDSSAIQLVAYDEDEDKLTEWLIGKESQDGTYIRHADEPEVYALEGNLRNRFTKNFNDWRDRTFLKTTRALINKLKFNYQADSGFVLEKRGREWMIGNQKADSASVDRYLKKIQLKELNAFHDEFSPASEPLVTLDIEGSKPQATVKAWKGKGDEWILTSSLQEGVYFKDPSFAGELFPGKEWFLEGD